MKRKKITIFIQNIYKGGGTERVVTLIANELSKVYDLEIVSLFKDADKPLYKVSSKVSIKNILNEELKPIKLYTPYIIHKTNQFFKNYETDIFVCAGMGMVPFSMSMRKKSRYISWEHFNAMQGKVGGIIWFGRWLSSKFINEIIVLTKKDVELNKKRFKSKGKIYQIYNPIEVVENMKPYTVDSKQIVSVGSLNSQKGFDMLIDVAEKVFSKHKDWQWHIYGEGELKDKLNNMIIEKELEKNVILKGRSNKMNEIYPNYGLFALTSRFEGFAMVNIEAHYAKLPIVAFNCNCGPDEIIQDNVNGYLIDCYDIDEMANKINKLIENPDIRCKMSENTMLDKEKLKMENIIIQWKKLIEEKSI